MRFVLTVLTAIVLTFGFMSPVSGQDYTAALDGLQEVPANASPGSGSGIFALDGANMLQYNVVFSGLVAPETAAHIHGPAPAGVNAAVIFTFAAGSPKIGAFGPLTAAQISDLNAGLWYVNIHSSTYPGGEIRGQILAAVPVENSSWGAIKEMFESQ